MAFLCVFAVNIFLTRLKSLAQVGAHTLPNTGSASYKFTDNELLRSPLKY